MNVLQILAMTGRLYRDNIAWYTLAGVALFISTLVASGFFVAVILVDILLALRFGMGGTWIGKPVVVAAMLAVTGVGWLAATLIWFASLGAFMHTCAQIGAGRREISLLSFVDYARMLGLTFWFIGMIEQLAGTILAAPFIVVGVLLGPSLRGAEWAGLAAGGLVFTLAQLPFWLAYPSEIITRRGAIPALINSIKASRSSPVASLVMLLVIFVLAAVPTVVLVFYPIYFFFILAPLVATLVLVHYEAVQGMIR